MIQKAIPEHGLRLIDKAYDGDTFEIGAGKFSDTLLGCTISNSVVTILKNNNFAMRGCKFFNTDFVFQKKASLDRLFTANYWEKCRFKGTHEGTKFGYWYESDYGPCPWGDISIRECDFSNSILRCCSFHRTELDKMVFPKWPCFTTLEPMRLAGALRKLCPPFADCFNSSSFEGVSAMTYEWSWINKNTKLKIDENEARDVLSKIDFVRM